MNNANENKCLGATPKPSSSVVGIPSADGNNRKGKTAKATLGGNAKLSSSGSNSNSSAGIRSEKTASGSAGKYVDQNSAKKNVCPSKKQRSELRLAMRLNTRLSGIPEAKRTPAQVKSLEWAKGVCEANKGKTLPHNTANSLTASKRQRSVEEGISPASKRPKGPPPMVKSFSEVAKGSLVIGVLDEGAEEGRIPRDKWRLVEGAILSVFMKVVEEFPGPIPSCEEVGWHQGSIMLMACADKRSADLYKLAVSRLGEIWPGAKLKAVDRQDIPSRPRARVWLPASSPVDPEEILRIVRYCNPSLPTADWKVVKVEDPVGSSRQVVMVLNRDSVKLLEEAKGFIQYGFTKVHLRVYKVDVLGNKEAESGSVGVPVEVKSSPCNAEGSNSEALPESDKESITTDIGDSIAQLMAESQLLLSDEDADVTVVENLGDESPADKPPPF